MGSRAEFDSLDTVRTVGDLRQLIAGLPNDMPVCQRGSAGDWRQGVEAKLRKAMRHKRETDFVADCDDRVWRARRKDFKEPHLVLGID